VEEVTEPIVEENVTEIDETQSNEIASAPKDELLSVPEINITTNITENITKVVENATPIINITPEINVTEPPVLNISETNITENITTEVNVSINATENISEIINITVEENVSEEIVENITEPVIEEPIVEDPIVEPEINITPEIEVPIVTEPIVLNVSENITDEALMELIIEHNASEFVIEYETEAPQMTEQEITPYIKRVTISSAVHYKEILTYTNITPAKKESIGLYWINNGTRTEFTNVTYIDTDSDGLIDKLEWIIPHLSNQTFEITITVLNVQSYPMVGGFWTVELNTTGLADLEVIPYNLTTFTKEPVKVERNGDDLEFEEFLCGDTEITDLFVSITESCTNGTLDVDNSVSCYLEDNKTYLNYSDILNTSLSLNVTTFKIYDYNCTDISYWTDTVRTAGAHHILFTYGPDNATAHNWAVKNATSVTLNGTVSIRRPSTAMTNISGAYLTLDSTEEYNESQHNTTWILDYAKDCQEEGNYEVYIEFMSLGNSRSEANTSGINEVITYWVDSCYIAGAGHINCTAHAKSKSTNAAWKLFGGRLELNSVCNITSVDNSDGDAYWTTDGQDTCSGADCGQWIEFYHNVSSSDQTDETTFGIMCDDGSDDNTVMLLDINETCGPQSCGTATLELGGFDSCVSPTCSDNFTYIGNDTVESLGGFELMTYDIGILDTLDWTTVTTYNITWDSQQSDCDCYVGSGYWALGGDINTCCGDDANENKTSLVADATMDNGYATNATDIACCDLSTDCVDENSCYANASVSTDADSDSDNDYCLEGTWYDCLTDSECGSGLFCNASYDCEESTLGIVFVDPTPENNSVQIDNTVTINVTVNSLGSNVSACLIEWQGSNQSMSLQGSGISVTCNATIATTDGTTYTYKVWANNTVSLWNTSKERTFLENTKPSVSAAVLTSTSGNNYTTDNLTVAITSSDSDGHDITNITDWRIGGTSIAVLNLPFDTNISTTASGAIRDYSTYKNNGTLGAGTASLVPVWISDGQVGGAYNFDGIDDQIETISEDGINSSTGTIEFWLKLNEADDNQGVWHFYESGTSDYIRSYISSSNVMDLYIEDDDDAKVGVTYDLDNLGSFVGEWMHIAWTQDGTGVKLYINGLQRTLSGTNNESWWTDHLALASGKIGYAWAPLNGSVDEFKVYNYSLTPEEINESYNAGSAGKHPTTLHSNATAEGETWTVAVTPNDGFEDGSTSTSNSLLINNSAPTIILLTPTNDTLLTQYDNRTPGFTWTASDSDGDSLNYTIWIAEDSAFTTVNITAFVDDMNYTASSDLDVDKTYWWIVEVFDGDTRTNSTYFNFTIESYKAINLTTSTVNFGTLEQDASADTENDASPMIIENIGNIYVNLTIYANTSLWETQALNTSYFEFKADTDEASAFNEGTSTMIWADVTDAPFLLLNKLDFHPISDSAQIDYNVTVPNTEPPESKQSQIIILS
ncbi:LamG-like jellyroll fold domain-containing protein, partial [Bacteroidota bacterium]